VKILPSASGSVHASDSRLQGIDYLSDQVQQIHKYT
jgi:hypothetical protein